MKIHHVILFTFVLMNLVFSAHAQDFSDFVPIQEQPSGDFDTILLGAACGKVLFDGNISNIHWHVMHTVNETDVVIETKPANLVNALIQTSNDNGTNVLEFTYTNVSAAIHEEGAGVVIKVPQDYIFSIDLVAEDTIIGQVLNGFTGISSIVLSSNFNLFQVDVGGADEVEILNVGDSNQVTVGTNVSTLLFLSGDSTVARLIDGSVASDSSISGDFNLLETSGRIESMTMVGNSNRIMAPNCDTIVESGEFNACQETTPSIRFITISPTSNSTRTINCGGGPGPNPTDASSSLSLWLASVVMIIMSLVHTM